MPPADYSPLWNFPIHFVTASAKTMSPCPENVGNMLGPVTLTVQDVKIQTPAWYSRFAGCKLYALEGKMPYLVTTYMLHNVLVKIRPA
jgi:hypothetical protein